MKDLWKIILFSFAVVCNPIFAEKDRSNLLSYDSLPERYKHYQDKHIIYFHREDIGENVYSYTEFDIDDDIIGDVLEVTQNRKVVAYGFDLNKNGDFECNEILLDDKTDGLNGNERALPPEACEKRNII